MSSQTRNSDSVADLALPREQRLLSPARSWALVFLLTTLTVFSYLDRQVLGLFVPDLKRDLGIGDIQVGILVGPAFVVSYCVALLVAATVVDRVNKIYLIFGGVIAWSLMTAATGFANSFDEIFVLRAGLAIGEAFLGPAAIALIGQSFDQKHRPIATALFVMGASVGASGSAAFAAAALELVRGWHVVLPRVGAAADWRLALIAISVPSIVLGAALLAIGKDTAARRAHEPKASGVEAARSLKAELAMNGGKYLAIFVGMGALLMLQIGVFIWTPVHLMRAFHLAQTTAGFQFGIVALIAGVLGTLMSAPIVRRWAPTGKASDFAALFLVLEPVGVLGLVGGGLAPTAVLCLSAFGLALFVLGVVAALPVQYLQLNAPAHLRGRIAVGFYFIFYLLGAGVGPTLPPLISRLLFEGPAALGAAIATLAVLVGVFSAMLMALLRISRSSGAPSPASAG